MNLDKEIKLFEGNQIRSVWDNEKEEVPHQQTHLIWKQAL